MATIQKTNFLSILVGVTAIFTVSSGVAQNAAPLNEEKTPEPAATVITEQAEEAPVPAAVEVATLAPEGAKEAAAPVPAAEKTAEQKTIELVPEPIPDEPKAPESDAPADDNEIEGVTVSTSDDPNNITVSLDGIDLETVVRLFTRLSQANIICNTTNVQNKTVTANLVNKPWDQALRAILMQHNMTLNEEPPSSGIFVIDVRKADAPEPWITQTFKLSFMKAAQAKTVLESFLGVSSPASKSSASKNKKDKGSASNDVENQDAEASILDNGRVVSYPAANIVVVSTTEKLMREVRDVIAAVDRERPQVYIEAKIVQISGSATKKIGIDWSLLDGYQVTAGPFDRKYSKTIARGGGSSTVGTSDNASLKNGSISSKYPDSTVWDSLYRIDKIEDMSSDKGSWSSSSSARTKFGESSVSDVRSAIFSADALSLTLSALEANDDTSLISNPKIIVANETTAVIDMTKKIPYVQIEKTTSGTGDNTDATYSTKMETIPLGDEITDEDGNVIRPLYLDGAFFSYGIRLDVTPRINNPSNITVVIQPVISESNGTVATGGDTTYPIIDVKSVKTRFSLGNGQTAVIGGLTQTKDIDIVKKIPILGSIPILGKYLFSHTTKSKEQTETIIFVTVGIVDKEVPGATMALPDGTRLTQKRIDQNGKIINKNHDTKEDGVVTPEAVVE